MREGSQTVLVMTVLACAACATAWAAALLRLAVRPRGAQPRRRPQPSRGREEDRVRPASDADGRPTWVDAEDLFWHEIVCWPPRSTAGRRSRTG